MVAGSRTSYKPRRKTRMFKKRTPFNKKQVKAIRKIAETSGELKYANITDTSSSLTNATAMSIVMPDIAQGDGDNQRIGDRITLRDYSVKAILNSGTANGLVRVYAIQFPDASETSVPELANLLPNDFYPTSEDIDGVKYRILYDRVFKVGSATNQVQLVNFKLSGKKLNRMIEYNADAGAAADIIKNRIVVYFTTENATASQITVDSNCRIRYYG